MKRAVWTHIAIADLREARDYLSGIDAALGDDLVDRALAASRYLSDQPGLGSPLMERWRKWRVPKTRYLLIYRPTRAGIEIGRIRYDRTNWRMKPE